MTPKLSKEDITKYSEDMNSEKEDPSHGLQVYK